MKAEIMILNTMIFEKDGKEKSRLGYIFVAEDCFSKSEKFRGFGDMSVFSDDRKLFDLIPIEWIGKKVMAYIKEVSIPNNPMRTKKVISAIECNGQTISLL